MYGEPGGQIFKAPKLMLDIYAGTLETAKACLQLQGPCRLVRFEKYTNFSGFSAVSREDIRPAGVEEPAGYNKIE